MSGAEAALVLGLVSSTLTILQAAYEIYNTAHDAKGHIKAFEAPAEQIPLVARTLMLIEDGLKSKSDEEVRTIQPIVKRCKEKASLIKGVFDKTLPSRDTTRMERYKKAFEAKSRSAEIKRSMEAIMQDLALLQHYRAFQDTETLEEIKVAVEGFARSSNSRLGTSAKQGYDRQASFLALARE